MIYTNQYFPFTPDSTRIIFDDVQMPLGLVYGALFYPRIKNSEQFGPLHISNMYTRFTNDGVEHHWTITDEFAGIILDVLFPTYDVKQNDVVVMPKGLVDEESSTGYVLQRSFCRGVVRCAKGFLSYVESLPVTLELEPDAFVLDITTTRYRQPAGFQEFYLDNERVTEFTFDEDDFHTTEDGTTAPNKGESNPNVVRTPITEIQINQEGSSITVDDATQHLSLVALSGSGIKVVTDVTSSISIGRSTDFYL